MKWALKFNLAFRFASLAIYALVVWNYLLARQSFLRSLVIFLYSVDIALYSRWVRLLCVLNDDARPATSSRELLLAVASAWLLKLNIQLNVPVNKLSKEYLHNYPIKKCSFWGIYNWKFYWNNVRYISLIYV